MSNPFNSNTWSDSNSAEKYAQDAKEMEEEAEFYREIYKAAHQLYCVSVNCGAMTLAELYYNDMVICHEEHAMLMGEDSAYLSDDEEGYYDDCYCPRCGSDNNSWDLCRLCMADLQYGPDQPVCEQMTFTRYKWLWVGHGKGTCTWCRNRTSVMIEHSDWTDTISLSCERCHDDIPF